MALTVVQINIRNWKKNRYLLQCELANLHPDLILINEIGEIYDNSFKLLGYSSLCKSAGLYSGVGILVKRGLPYIEIPTTDLNTIAIKLYTVIGPIIIATSYIPPRIPHLPIIAYNKILNYNLPTVICGDLNAQHPFLHNTQGQGNARGKQLHNLALNKRLTYKGPDFQTYITRYKTGKPDVIVTNYHFNILHMHIQKGNHVGSDHIPVILKISTTPLKELRQPHLDLKTLDITKYKDELADCRLDSLNHQSIDQIDVNIDKIFNTVSEVVSRNCSSKHIKYTQSYKPTVRIKNKLKQLQSATLNYYTYGYPTLNKLHDMKEQLITIIKEDNGSNWSKVVDIATESYGDPKKFWRKIKNLMGGDPKTQVPFRIPYENDDSEDSDFGQDNVELLFDSQDKVECLVHTWKQIFTPNSATPNNLNIFNVTTWYHENKNALLPESIINHDRLIAGHPLLRPVEMSELKFSIQKLKNTKAPGPSHMRAVLIKNFPLNIKDGLIDIFNSMLCTKYFPDILLNIKMIFHNKKNADPSDPRNYRPISLIECLCKVFERIITNRLIYFGEFHNLFNEFQFGFRRGRSTQQIITMVAATLQENTKQGKVSLIGTRDISKAFDTVWHPGLMFKLHKFTDESVLISGLIHYYLTNRKVTIHHNNTTGTPFTPKAGVPQGSVIGPILFNIYVNDIPSPKYYDTIRPQFADDVVTITRSFGKGQNKVVQARDKLQDELKIITDWEEDWRIKVNPDKCVIACKPCFIEELDLINGIHINNTTIQTTTNATILGYKFNFNKLSTQHITDIINKARGQINRLYRFRDAPVKIKRHLYVALVRPMLEYPSFPIYNTGITNKHRLQRVQNKATRFITDIRLRERVSSRELHIISKLDPMNIRMNKLAHKHLFKLKEKYYNNNYLFNPGTDFEFDCDPKLERPQSLAQNIHDFIFNDPLNCPWHSPIDMTNWIPPPPLFI